MGSEEAGSAAPGRLELPMARELFLICALLTAPAWAQTSLLVNGSFEDGPNPGSFTNLAAGTTTVRGWVVTGEGIDYIGTLWRSSDGRRSLDLDGSRRSVVTPPYAIGGIAQTFATKPGARYLVTFDLAGNPFRPPATKPMRLSAAGQQMVFTFDIAGKNAANMGWRSERWTFEAKAASTTLEFRSLTVSPLTGWGPVIDNVSVTEVGTRQPLEVTENEKEIQVTLQAAVLFDTGKYDLKPAATEALRELAVVLKKYPGLPIKIEGHTDSVGRREANQLLSENRAGAVKTWLTSNAAIPPGRIETKGYGQTAPVASNETADGRQKNRRVQIRLLKVPPAKPVTGNRR